MMAELGDNSRYANYARANGRSPEAQLDQDRKDWPGGTMVGFVVWNNRRLKEFSREHPNAFTCDALVDHAAYDAWLTAWVDHKLSLD